MTAHDDSAESMGLPGRRRRSFLATRQEASLDAGTLPIQAAEDDIPVLTEIVEIDEEDDAAPIVDEQAVDLSATLDARLEELATQMAQAIGQQMAYELPTLIEATLLNASEDLRTGITETMEAALRDFIARRKQLQLPLDDPDSEQRALY